VVRLSAASYIDQDERATTKQNGHILYVLLSCTTYTTLPCHVALDDRYIRLCDIGSLRDACVSMIDVHGGDGPARPGLAVDCPTDDAMSTTHGRLSARRSLHVTTTSSSVSAIYRLSLAGSPPACNLLCRLPKSLR